MKKLFDFDQAKRFWGHIKDLFLPKPKNEGSFGKYLKFVSEDTTEWADFPTALVFKGVVDSFEQLPNKAERGDLYHITGGDQAGAEYFYTGESWEYVGQLVKVTYKPADENAKTIALGGIAAGTNANDLKDKTLSELFDMLLFPTYAPQWSAGALTTNLSSKCVPIFNEVPDLGQESVTLTPPKAITSSKTVTCQQKINSFHSSAGRSGVWSLEQGKVYGVITYNFSMQWNQSTEQVSDSKGKPTNKTAANQTTLLSDAAINDAIDDNYYIKEGEAKCTLYYYYVYPYYYNDTQISLTKEDSFYYTVDATTDTSKWSLEFPSDFNVKIIPPDIGGNYSDSNDLIAAGTIAKTTNSRTVGEESVNYTVYTPTDITGSKKVLIKLSRK